MFIRLSFYTKLPLIVQVLKLQCPVTCVQLHVYSEDCGNCTVKCTDPSGFPAKSSAASLLEKPQYLPRWCSTPILGLAGRRKRSWTVNMYPQQPCAVRGKKQQGNGFCSLVITDFMNSIIPRPSPSFPSLVVQYCKRQEAGRGPGNEAIS